MRFAHRLAATLGMTVAELGQRMSVREFFRWQVLEQIEPFGPFADWIRHGDLMALIANIVRRKGTRTYRAEDFVPNVRERRRQTPAEQLLILRANLGV